MLAEATENLMEQIDALATQARETEGEQTPQMRGARIITELYAMYGFDEDSPETLLRDALADIRHAYDLLPESSYHTDERAAYFHYLKESEPCVRLVEPSTFRKPYRPTVMIHGYLNTADGGQEHWDSGDELNDKPDGWNVWLRRDFLNVEPHEIEPFDDDTSRERDFETYDDAMVYVRKLSKEFQCEIDEY